jgi:Zn-dependent protease
VLSEVVEKHFKVHRIEGDRFRIAFFTRETAKGDRVVTDSPPVDAAFEALRVELKKDSFVPTLQIAGDDGVVTVSRVNDPQFRSSRVNSIFFVLTLFSVQLAGALLWASYVSPHGPTGNEPQLDWLSGEAQVGGVLYFTLPLLAILGLHEMGHFVTARHYHVRASLPFFIPSTPPLGTFGAFISMRDPLPSRRVIFDIGLSGPMVGFLASIVVTAVGSVLMQGTPSPTRPEIGNSVNLGTPLMFEWILGLVGTAEDSYLHPTLFAGWAGFLVTAFNLIPAAQLDGGHVMFSLLGNHPNRPSRAVAISACAVLGIAVLGSLLGYNGWLLLIIIVFLTIRHPPPLNQVSSLDFKRLLAGLMAVAVFAVSFAPAPISIVGGDYAFEAAPEALAVEVPAGGAVNVTLNFTNMGNSFNTLVVEVKGSAGPFTAVFEGSNATARVVTNRLEFINRTLNVTVVSLALIEGERGAVYLLVTPEGDPSLQRPVVIYAVAVAAHPGLSLAAPSNATAAPGAVASVALRATNDGDVPYNLTWSVANLTWTWAYGFEALGALEHTVRLGPGESSTVSFLVEVSGNATAGDEETFTVAAVPDHWPAARSAVSFSVRAGA